VLDSSQLRQPSASLQLLVRLLHAARPEGFASFRAFARWRGGACATLAAVLVWSTCQFRLQLVRAASAASLHIDPPARAAHAAAQERQSCPLDCSGHRAGSYGLKL
jgi:hypothetical protein